MKVINLEVLKLKLWRLLRRVLRCCVIALFDNCIVESVSEDLQSDIFIRIANP
jgi:hypothetical protein